MKLNLAGRFILIVVAIVLAALAWHFNPPKGGIDLVGGTDLLYEVDLSNYPGTPPGDLADRVIGTLKKRVGPNGLKNLTWRVVGGKRIEIQMPFADQAAKKAKEQY